MKNSEEQKNHLVISYITLRQAIGWLGVSLPFALIVWDSLVGQCAHLQDSISHYYYTSAGSLFVGTLCAVGLFLITYKGYSKTPEGKPDKQDNRLSTMAGIFAFGVALLPTDPPSHFDSCAYQNFFGDNHLRVAIHYGCAALFFLLLAYMSYARFTLSNEDPKKLSRNKKIKNKLHRTCAVIMIAACVIIALSLFSNDIGELYSNYNVTFWMEWLALLAFGTSWLTKGEVLLSSADEDISPSPVAAN